MKEKTLKVLKSNTLFALLLNSAALALCVIFTSFAYGSHADYNLSVLICRDHFYYNGTVNYILAMLAGTAEYAFPNINCFALFEVGASFVAFCSMTFVFADKYQKRKAFVYSAVLNILFAMSHYQSVDSTRTAALLCASGFMLVLLAIYNKRYTMSCWVGVAEIVLGSFFNITYFFIALGFAVAFFFGDLMAKRKYRLQFQKLFWYFRPFLLMFILVSLITLGLHQFSYSVNHATPEAENYYEYAVLKNEIDSLPYPGYFDHEEEFAEAGINSESDYELLKNNYYDDNTSLDVEALRTVHEIQLSENPKNFINTSAAVFRDNYESAVSLHNSVLVLAVYLALSLVFIFYHKNRFSFFPLFYAIVGFISGFMLRFFYSGSENLTYGIWVFMIAMLLNSFNFEVLRREKPSSKLRMNNGYMIISCAVVALLATVNGIIVFYTMEPRKEGDEIRGILSEIGRNPDNYYVLDPETREELIEYTENFVHPMWGFREEYLDNLDDFGYFHQTEKLRRRNLPENIYEAVLSNKKIYVIDKTLVIKKERYFSEHYTENGSVTYEQLSEPNGYGVYELKVS